MRSVDDSRPVPPPVPERSLAQRIARFRVASGFVLGIVVLWLAQPTPAAIAVGGAIALLGEVLRVWAAGHLNKAREVTTSGPYRWVPHPLYVGSSIMGLGLAVASRSVIVLIVILAYLGATLSAAVKSEEAFLRARFGDRYDDYRRGTVGSNQRFSFARAKANREYRAAAGLLVAVLLLIFKATYNGVFWRSGPP
jgi:protein-S-isoprenylcysteine O-methyltransferase Ste14